MTYKERFLRLRSLHQRVGFFSFRQVVACSLSLLSLAGAACNDPLKTPKSDSAMVDDAPVATGGSGQGGGGPDVVPTGGQGAGGSAGSQGSGGISQGGVAGTVTPGSDAGVAGAVTGGSTGGGAGIVVVGNGGVGAGGVAGAGKGGSTGKGGAGTVVVGTGGVANAGGVTGTGGVANAGGVTGAGGVANAGGATGAGGVANAGGAAGAGGGSGGAGGATSCPVLTQAKSSRTARSAGFTGTYSANYYPLYNTSCTTVAECTTACVAAGGTQSSCTASECIHSTKDYCLPPTYWFDLDRLRIEGGTIEDSAWITMVNNPYRDQLVATEFQFEVPADATVQGIEMSINRSADSTSSIADYEVKLVRDGATVGLDRAGTKAWPSTFEYASYGGASDQWGATWTPASVNAAGFGVAFTPMYLSSGGNARGYVDFIRATIYYTSCR